MVDDALDEQQVLLEGAELAAFAQKLGAWTQSSLSARERIFLEQMLADAADAANQDVSGYVNLSSFPSDDVAGSTTFAAAVGSVIDSVVGYAHGLAASGADALGTSFDPGSDVSAI